MLAHFPGYCNTVQKVPYINKVNNIQTSGTPLIRQFPNVFTRQTTYKLTHISTMTITKLLTALCQIKTLTTLNTPVNLTLHPELNRMIGKNKHPFIKQTTIFVKQNNK